jgi:hypothetical protein
VCDIMKVDIIELRVYVGVIQFLFFNWTPLFDWCVVGDDQRTNVIKIFFLNKLDYLFKFQ